MKRSLLFLPFVLLSCTPPVTVVDIPGMSKSDSVVLKDLRPASEKENEMFSYSITNDAYAISRKGDALLNPPAIRLFQHRVHEKLGASPKPIEITVHHMVVYLNAQAAFKRSALGSVGGVIGAALAAGSTNKMAEPGSTIVNSQAFESLNKEEYKRALYTEKENPNKASVYIVYIDAEVNGKRIFVRTMSPETSKESKNPVTDAIESCIRYYLTNY